MNDPTNYYLKMKKEFQPVKRNYENEAKVNIELPFRGIICGKSGQMKTNLVIDLFTSIGVFTNIVICTKDKTEPLYAWFEDTIKKVEKKLGTKILNFYDTMDDIPELNHENYDKNENTLLIIDDMVLSGPKSFKTVNQVYMAGRKYGCSVVFITQKYFTEETRFIRANAEYTFLKKCNGDEAKRIISIFTDKAELSETLKKYKDAMSVAERFFMIDTKTTNDDLKFRINYG